MSISVITAALPSRPGMLAEAIASVAAQTLRPIEHLIGIDHARRGSSAVRNGLLAAAQGEWIAVLDDDDLLDPTHLESLSAHDADIVYPFTRISGREGWHFGNFGFDADRLRRGNYIPVTALVRASLLRELGGWRDASDCTAGFEDWDLWLRALDAKARFACTGEITWTYRFHAGNKSSVGEGAAA